LFGRLRASGIAAAALAVVASWLVLSWPWLGGEAVVPWDSKDQFYPALGFVADSIRSGEQPFWNPFIYGGYPMVSDPQSMMFSPLALFLMLLAETPSVRWFDAIELLHLLMGGLGLLWFSMRQGLSPLAGVFPAVVYMFGGAAAARLQHVPMICAYGYVPLALLALDTALETGRLRHAAAFGLVGGVMAAHQNQVAYLFCLVLLAYALWRILSSGRPARFLSDRWRALAVACTFGALTLAAPLYATLQFLPLTRRIDLPPEVSGENALHPLSWLTFLVVEFFGNSDPSVYWGLGDLTETYLYAGALPIVLILIVGFGGGALSEGRARFWLGVGLLACLYALGNLTPFYGFLYELLPGVSFYRRPADAAFVLNLVLAVLTGFLIERLRHGPLARRGSLALLAALAFLAGLLSMGLLEALREARFGGLPEALAAAAAWFLPAVLLVAVLARPLSSILRRRLVLASFLFLLFDIGFNNINQYFNSADPVDFGALDPGIGSPRPLAALERELGIDPGGGA
jgi:hypothetical protein